MHNGQFFYAIVKKALDRGLVHDLAAGKDRHGGRAGDGGVQRVIHNIQNAPFRTKFEHISDEMRGTSAIGCISDTDPQPLLIRSHHGTYVIGRDRRPRRSVVI